MVVSPALMLVAMVSLVSTMARWPVSRGMYDHNVVVIILKTGTATLVSRSMVLMNGTKSQAIVIMVPRSMVNIGTNGSLPF